MFFVAQNRSMTAPPPVNNRNIAAPRSGFRVSKGPTSPTLLESGYQSAQNWYGRRPQLHLDPAYERSFSYKSDAYSNSDSATSSIASTPTSVFSSTFSEESNLSSVTSQGFYESPTSTVSRVPGPFPPYIPAVVRSQSGENRHSPGGVGSPFRGQPPRRPILRIDTSGRRSPSAYYPPGPSPRLAPSTPQQMSPHATRIRTPVVGARPFPPEPRRRRSDGDQPMSSSPTQHLQRGYRSPSSDRAAMSPMLLNPQRRRSVPFLPPPIQIATPPEPRSVRWNDILESPSPIFPSQRRRGWFNRRGDQLWTNEGAYKPAPPGHEFPADLRDYPEYGWMNEDGVRIDMNHRLVPKAPLRSALKQPRPFIP